MKKFACLLLAVVVTPAFASGIEPAMAGLAGFAALAVGAGGGALAGWFGWSHLRVIAVEVLVVVASCALFLLLLRPQDFSDGIVRVLFIAAFVSIIPLLICHYPAYAIGKAFSPREVHRERDKQ